MLARTINFIQDFPHAVMICWFGVDFFFIYFIILTETGTMPSLLVINLFVYLCRGNRRAGLGLCFLGCCLFPTRALGAVWHWHCVLKRRCFPQPCRQQGQHCAFTRKIKSTSEGTVSLIMHAWGFSCLAAAPWTLHRVLTALWHR